MGKELRVDEVDLSPPVGDRCCCVSPDKKGFQQYWRESRKSNPSSERVETDGTMPMDHAYQILGLPPSADPLKVKQVYRDLAEAWHFDTSGITDDGRMKEINAAYDYLKQTGRAR